MNIDIRPEQSSDFASVEHLVGHAFSLALHSSGTEVLIIRELRKAGALSLSLVATEGGTVKGYLAASPVTLSDETPDWHGLGPIAVAPEAQGKGIGGRLVMTALTSLRAAGAAGCVVLGDPAFYGRFGFREAPGLTLPDVPPEYFQAIGFGSNLPQGTVTYHDAFNAVTRIPAAMTFDAAPMTIDKK